jgi:hypothetical protein
LEDEFSLLSFSVVFLSENADFISSFSFIVFSNRVESSFYKVPPNFVAASFFYSRSLIMLSFSFRRSKIFIPCSLASFFDSDLPLSVYLPKFSANCAASFFWSYFLEMDPNTAPASVPSFLSTPSFFPTAEVIPEIDVIVLTN